MHILMLVKPNDNPKVAVDRKTQDIYIFIHIIFRYIYMSSNNLTENILNMDKDWLDIIMFRLKF